MVWTFPYNSPIGSITLASDGESLTGLWFDGQKFDRATVRESSRENGDLPVFKSAVKWLDIYFSGKAPDFTPPLKIEGSDFKKAVAKIMLEIPFGRTKTYGDIAKELARTFHRKAMSAQAVGGAVGHNAIAIIVPCHRVLGKGGKLTGYAGGLERKIFLLKNEGLSASDYKALDVAKENFVI
jgi:O-6-methylguanine DNA methyltransferase